MGSLVSKPIPIKYIEFQYEFDETNLSDYPVIRLLNQPFMVLYEDWMKPYIHYQQYGVKGEIKSDIIQLTNTRISFRGNKKQNNWPILPSNIEWIETDDVLSMNFIKSENYLLSSGFIGKRNKLYHRDFENCLECYRILSDEKEMVLYLMENQEAILIEINDRWPIMNGYKGNYLEH